MPPERAGRWAVLATLVALPGCGGGEDPYRVGVVVDCVGINRPLHDAELSGAQLPLVERGAEQLGRLPDDGVTTTEVGGREVELVPGCTEIYEFSALNAEVRRLIERENVDAIVAGGSGPDEIVLRDIAQRHDEVVFIPVVHGPREVTLEQAAPNLFRFAQDHGQGVAGLGTYAYRELGWRNAAVALGNWDTGWGQRDAFAAEFCGLGGTLEEQLTVDFFDPEGGDVKDVPDGVDGVAVFAPGFHGPQGFLKRLAQSVGRPASEIVVGPSVTGDPAVLGPTARALDGVTGTSFADPARTAEYLDAHREAFPGIPADVAGSELVTAYRDAMEALLSGLEDADGESSALPATLATERVELLSGPVRLDDRGQAIASTWLVRIDAPKEGGDSPSLSPIRETANVEQSLGGLLARSDVPSDQPAPCDGGSPG